MYWGVKRDFLASAQQTTTNATQESDVHTMGTENTNSRDRNALEPQRRINTDLATGLPQISLLASFVYLGGFTAQLIVAPTPHWPPILWSNLATALWFFLQTFLLQRWPASAQTAHPILAIGAIVVFLNMVLRVYTGTEPIWVTVLFPVGIGVVVRSPRWFFTLVGTATVVFVMLSSFTGAVPLQHAIAAHAVALLIANLLFNSRYNIARRSEIRAIELEQTVVKLGEVNARQQQQFERLDATTKELMASEERYRLLVDLSPLSIIIRSGTDILFANKATLEILGLDDIQQLLGRSVIDYIAPEHRSAFLARMHEVDASEQPNYSQIWQYCMKNGNVIDVEVSSAPILYEGRRARLAIGKDVTEARAAQRQMKILQTATDSSLEGVILCDPHGFLTYVNARGLTLLGESSTEAVIGHHASEYVGVPECAQAITAALRTEGAWVGEATVVNRAGEQTPVNLAAHRVRDRNGTPIATMGFFQDISKEVALRKHLEEAKEKAEFASQAKSLFLSSMSHELRTPLNSVIGFSELLLSAPDQPLDADRLQYVKHIARSGQHLLDLISDLLDLGKIDSGALELHLEGIPADSLIRECVAMVEAIARVRSVNVCPMPSKNSAFRGDRRRCRQILINLLSNAIFYSPVGSRVQIDTAICSDGMVRITVHDQGPGIPKEEIATVFQRFRRLEESAKSRPEGSGIGLALVKRLVEIQNGRISVASVVGEGSAFSFDMPEHLGELDAESEIPVVDLPDMNLSNDKLRILVAEDNLVNMFLVREYIARLGHTMYEAHNGKEAVEMATALRPDVILMDVSMPILDGLDATRQLRKTEGFESLPIIALTAHADAESIKRSTNAGCTEHITKPLKFGVLKRVLRDCVVRSE